MIIWRGWGIIVGIVAILGFLIAETITTFLTSDNSYSQNHILPRIFGVVLASSLVFGMVKILEKNNKPKILIDKETGKEIAISRKDDLFFIPIKYLPHVIFIGGLVITILNYFKIIK